MLASFLFIWREKWAAGSWCLDYMIIRAHHSQGKVECFFKKIFFAIVKSNLRKSYPHLTYRAHFCVHVWSAWAPGHLDGVTPQEISRWGENNTRKAPTVVTTPIHRLLSWPPMFTNCPLTSSRSFSPCHWSHCTFLPVLPITSVILLTPFSHSTQCSCGNPCLISQYRTL